jgi:hypothetical protein
VRDKFKRELRGVHAFARACGGAAQSVWRSSAARKPNRKRDEMNRCGVFFVPMIKKMHRMHRFVMLFVDMLLRKAE